MKAIGISIKKRNGGKLDVRLSEFFARSETAFLDPTVEQVFQARPHHRAGAARRRRREENVQDVVGLTVDLDQHFPFQLVRSDQCHA